MGGDRTKHSRCSIGQCTEPVKFDLVLFERNTIDHKVYTVAGKQGVRKQICRQTRQHLYLCEKHGLQMLDFMDCYEVEEAD